MRTIQVLPLVLSLITLVSCEDTITRTRTYQANLPKYLSHDELRQTVVAQEPRSISSTGKIYFKEDYIFIADGVDGIHVIDNTNPASPNPVAFIPVPGVNDMVIKSTTMYVSSYTDLVILDVSAPAEAIELSRIEDALLNAIPIANGNLPMASIDSANGVVVGWEVGEWTETLSDDDDGVINSGGIFWGREEVFMNDALVTTGGVQTTQAGNMTGRTQGVGGSMAGFSLNGNHLHVVQQWNMKTFDLSDKLAPQMVDEQWLWREGETLFRLGATLYIGTTSGMMIFDVEDPSKPEYLSEVTHFTGCDPVVVEEDRAYVTVRAGSTCGWSNWESQLMVIDVSDRQKPVQIATHLLNDPYGLGIKNEVLFICDGTTGLRVFDAHDPHRILDNQIAVDSTITARDVIPFENSIMVIGEGALNQYSYDGTTVFTLLSSLSIQE